MHFEDGEIAVPLSTVVCSQCRSRKKYPRLLLLIHEIISSGKPMVCLLCIYQTKWCTQVYVLSETMYGTVKRCLFSLRLRVLSLNTFLNCAMVWKGQEFSGNRALSLELGSSVLYRLYSRVSYYTHFQVIRRASHWYLTGRLTAECCCYLSLTFECIFNWCHFQVTTGISRKNPTAS